MAGPLLNILIVEDHPDVAEILSIDLKRLGHVTTIVGDAAGALDVVNKSWFNLIFCDIGLPDSDGCDLFQKINQIRPTCGIALSGYVQEDEIQRFKKAGFLFYLEKPFNLNDIGKAMDRVLEENDWCLSPDPTGGSHTQPPV